MSAPGRNPHARPVQKLDLDALTEGLRIAELMPWTYRRHPVDGARARPVTHETACGRRRYCRVGRKFEKLNPDQFSPAIVGPWGFFILLTTKVR